MFSLAWWGVAFVGLCICADAQVIPGVSYDCEQAVESEMAIIQQAALEFEETNEECLSGCGVEIQTNCAANCDDGYEEFYKACYTADVDGVLMQLSFHATFTAYRHRTSTYTCLPAACANSDDMEAYRKFVDQEYCSEVRRAPNLQSCATTVTIAPAPSPSQPPADNGPSGGTVAAIVIGVLALVFMAVGGFMYYRRRRPASFVAF